MNNRRQEVVAVLLAPIATESDPPAKATVVYHAARMVYAVLEMLQISDMRGLRKNRLTCGPAPCQPDNCNPDLFAVSPL